MNVSHVEGTMLTLSRSHCTIVAESQYPSNTRELVRFDITGWDINALARGLAVKAYVSATGRLNMRKGRLALEVDELSVEGVALERSDR